MHHESKAYSWEEYMERVYQVAPKITGRSLIGAQIKVGGMRMIDEKYNASDVNSVVAWLRQAALDGTLKKVGEYFTVPEFDPDPIT